MSRFSRGDRPVSQALRACTINASVAGRHDRRRERRQRLFRILVVDADPAFHRHRDRHRGLHGGDAIADQRRLRHQAGAEAALLHALGRTADVEIDLVVAEIRADPRTVRERSRIGAAELQRHRMLGRIETDQPRAVAAQHRAGGHHLGIDQRAARQQAMEEPAMPVGPLHHRRNGKASVYLFFDFCRSISHFIDILYFSVTLMSDHFCPFSHQKYSNVVLSAQYVVPRLENGTDNWID